MKTATTFLLAVGLLLSATGAWATDEECVLFGNCTAEPNLDNPELGAWKYTLVIEWETAKHGISHIDMIVDDGENCTASDLLAGLFFEAVAGQALGEPASCQVQLHAELEMRGDPSIPGVEWPIFKFEYDDGGCELTELGSATIEFYSEYGPYPIAEDNLFLVDKFARYYCWGPLGGDFPALPCSPVGSGEASWSGLKARYAD